MQRYEELRIRIRRTAPGRYLVLASGPACAVGMLDCAEGEPAALRAELDRLIGIELGAVPRGRTRVETAVPDLGRRLYRMLFAEPLSQCFKEALEQAQSRGMRLRLRFDLPHELQELPVEVLTSPPGKVGGRMALNPDLSLVRTLSTGISTARAPQPDDEPDRVRVVIAVSAAVDGGMAPIDAGAEAAELEKLPDLAAEICHVPAVREELVSALGEGGERPSALVLAAHGIFDAEERVGAVFLQTPEGASHRIPAHVLASSLSQSGRLRFAVLNLCSGAVAAPAEPHAGLAQGLVAHGVPAVAAMRGPISDRAAARFSPEVMEKLLENRTVDEAVTAARIAISAVPGHTTVEWCTPVLFLHESYRHGWLFKARHPLRKGESARAEDPLRAGARSVAAYEHEGNVSMDTIHTALHHLRDAGDWPSVARVTRGHNDPVCRTLFAEACREQDWPVIAEVCEALADRRDADGAEELLDRLGEQSRSQLCGHLTREIRAVRLQCLADLAERHRVEGAWASAVDAYADVQALAEAPDQLRAVAQAVTYCRARLSEEAGDWPEACSRHREAGGYADSEARAAHAAGRAAAADDKWEAAAGFFTDACTCSAQDVDPSWTAYAAHARGRVAAERGAWADAVECFKKAGDLADSPTRLLLCEARAAIDAAQWAVALDHLLRLDACGGDAGPWLDDVRSRVGEGAEDAAGRREWAVARDLFTVLAAVVPSAAVNAAYCAARGAEQNALWQQAGDSYAACLGHADSERRFAYARGRVAEQAGDWAAAALRYEGLPGHFLDTGRRLSYVRGRAADATGNWQGVIDGFGGLPDEAEQGDVGARRWYARYRIADGHGDRHSLLNFNFPDHLAGSDRAGDIAALRAKAHGSLAEQRGDWAAALEHYAESMAAARSPELVGAARQLLAYARGRRHEAAAEWNRAAEAYGELPGDYRDAAVREGYAHARDAEQQAPEEGVHEAGKWAAIAGLYEVLPADFADADVRACYARALCAEARGCWTDAVSEAAQLADHRDAAAIVAYARAREAELAGDWARAASEFDCCTGRRDAAARGAHARGRHLEATGQWSAALTLYEQAGDALPEAGARRRRIRRLLDAAAWADGLAGESLVADPYAYALGKDAFPYRTLQDVGVTSASSIDEIQAATYVLMERGGMNEQELDAWERLRRPATRLEIDALLYQVSRPDRLRARLAAFEPGGADDLVERLSAELPQDATLLRLVAHGRDEALAAWSTVLAETPGDMDAVHAAAIARRWQAVEYEEGGAWEHAAPVWREAAVLWAALLSSDGHWSRWSEARTVCYRRRVAPDDVTSLRSVLSRALTAQLDDYAERHTAQRREAQAETYRELGFLFEAELDGAHALSAIGGLPLSDGSPLTFSAGPEYVRTMGLGLQLAGTVARLEREATPSGPGDQAGQEVRWAFSSLAKAFTLYRHQRFDAALAELPTRTADVRELPEDCSEVARSETGHISACPHCTEFLDCDPVYTLLPQRRTRLLRDTAELVVRCQLACTRAALNADEASAVPDALKRWRAALRSADAVRMGVRTKSDILEIVLARVHTWAGAAGTEAGAKLDRAVRLVDGASELLCPLAPEERKRLDVQHSRLLAIRGEWRGLTCTDHGFPRHQEAAEADLRRALELNPEAVRPRDSLVRCLLFGMAERLPADDAVGRMRTLWEAFRLLDEGLRHEPAHSTCLATLTEIAGGIETVLLNGLSLTQMRTHMDEVIRKIEESGDDVSALAARLTKDAVRALECGDITIALDNAARAVRHAPQEAAARAALERSLNAWLRRHDPYATTDDRPLTPA
ncbi:CHAT domain-containing protein [Streptomyces sp. NPDC001401]|uniref:CHAT domain-containing protein n=1 Tax=Streptomyces sp. NPDC001401 TaxID=3364570 RepID=UPI0036B4FEC1